ncbi:MAG TPA: DNA topoisomerase IB [Mycobacteriales bacterium]|jgi:DNA topoisomerase IB|nr:DNA topoisomerase IB [Mycobacteriales bacterium]
MPRLRRSNPAAPGIVRRRAGRGFTYRDDLGETVTDPDTLGRIRDLVIPPAWTDVWICPWPHGHIQAVGTDAAGRRQYLYHPQWRVHRDRVKFDRILDLGERLPDIRLRLREMLGTRGLNRERVLAAAVRMLDQGFFRVGGEVYAAENGSFGLATLRREHVEVVKGSLIFCYPAKSGVERLHAVADEDVVTVVKGLLRRDDPAEELLSFRDRAGWHDIRSPDINAFLCEVAEGEFSAKDFRTWHATVLMAVALAVSHRVASSPAARKRAVTRGVKEVAEYLGNTPSVCRASYIDPRVIDLFGDGVTIERCLDGMGRDATGGALATEGAVEEAVLRMLRRAD